MKRWGKYIKPYLKYFICGPICMIIEVIGEVLMPTFLALIINAANAGTLTVGSSIGYAALMVMTALMMMAGGIGGSYFGAKASVNFAADLRSDLFAKVQAFSFANIDRFSTGSLVTRLTNDVTQMQNMVNMCLRMLLRSPGMLIGALIMAIRLNPSLSLVLAVTIPLMLVAIGLIIIFGFSKFGLVQEKIDNLNNTTQENITNVRVVKSFVREQYEIQKFNRANTDLKKTATKALSVVIFMGPVISLFMYFSTLAVLLFGSKTVLAGEMPVGDLSSFVTYVSQIMFSLMMVTMMLMMMSRALASAKRIREVLDETADVLDIYAAEPQKEVTEGSITFRGVSFRYYKHSEEAALKKIDLHIDAGKTVGIIGSTGCGKTTLVSLIPRLYDADEGEVLVDGVNVKDYSLKNLRNGVGMILQKNVLFSGTIVDNLRWGDKDATDEEIRDVAEKAQAHKFIESFPDGYLTELDQGGTNVSGGQKQRLCIARALLARPKILILDDSTSAVDTATEAMIRKAFREDIPDSTKIIIAQRISSVEDADIIVVMDNGVITGIGKHDELLNANVAYQEIYESQIGKRGEA